VAPEASQLDHKRLMMLHRTGRRRWYTNARHGAASYCSVSRSPPRWSG
jgi:hypothetical protein